MKIIILGAGQVGASVAENLVSEANDITLVDTSAEYLAALRDRLEVRTVCGNAASPTVLREAGANDADLLIAVTQSDQTNLCACRIAKAVFNLPTRIARLRSTDYVDHPELLGNGEGCVEQAPVVGLGSGSQGHPVGGQRPDQQQPEHRRQQPVDEHQAQTSGAAGQHRPVFRGSSPARAQCGW